MPRIARIKSSTGIYHCILRGVAKRDIFLDDQDRYKFIKMIKETKEKYNYGLYAYCLMDNHVHMLIKENKDQLSQIMHDLTLKYSMYFNIKYERVGHLFQNRYISKPVDNERYLLTVQKYIHQNPPYMETYKWSSYKAYIEDKHDFIDTNEILELFGRDINDFKRFTCKTETKMTVNEYKDCEQIRNVPDEKVIGIISQILQIDNILTIKKYNTKIRNKYLKRILEIDGVTAGQLSRIMEIDKKTLLMIKREK